MTPTIHTKKVWLPTQLRQQFQAKLAKLQSRYHRLLRVNMRIEQDKRGWFFVTLTAHWPQKRIVIEKAQPSLSVALNDALESLNRVLRKHYEKRRDQQRAAMSV